MYINAEMLALAYRVRNQLAVPVLLEPANKLHRTRYESANSLYQLIHAAWIENQPDGDTAPYEPDESCEDVEPPAPYLLDSDALDYECEHCGCDSRVGEHLRRVDVDNYKWECDDAPHEEGD